MDYTFTNTGKTAFEKAEQILIEKLRSSVYEQALRRGEPVEITQSDVESVLKNMRIESPFKGRLTDWFFILYSIIGGLITIGAMLFPVLNRMWQNGDYITRFSYIVALVSLIFTIFVIAIYFVRQLQKRRK